MLILILLGHLLEKGAKAILSLPFLIHISDRVGIGTEIPWMEQVAKASQGPIPLPFSINASANIQGTNDNKNPNFTSSLSKLQLPKMRLAVIDIGSNAIRLQITKVIEFEKVITFKKLQYVRFPLRLGQDVFHHKKIGTERESKFMNLMTAYKSLIELYEVDHYYGCATSAMRESSNGKEIVERTLRETGLKINIISGQKEADLINNVINLDLDENVYLHIDVGGGSTELNFYKNREKVLSKSFDIGSVRRMEHLGSPRNWGRMKDWIHDQVKDYKGTIRAIGTGGNINKIYELANGKKKVISLNTVMRVQDFLKNMSYEDRLNKLQLNPDRADVIIPASEIYIHAMQAAKAKSIFVPGVGLKDGINYYLFDKYYPSKGKVVVKNT